MSIKNKFATAVATASLLAGLFGSAFVPSALAVREVALDTPSVAKTETYSNNNDYIMPVLGSNGIYTGSDRAYWATTVDYSVYNGYVWGETVYSLDNFATDNQIINYDLKTKYGDSIGTADLKATSSSSVIKVKWRYNDGGTEEGCQDIDGDDTFTTTDTVTDVDASGGFRYYLCIHGNNKPGVATIAVVANGVTLAPVTVTVLGDIASVTVAADGTYVAEDNNEVDNFFKYTAKDSAGSIINGPNTGVGGGIYLEDFFSWDPAEGNPDNQQGDMFSPVANFGDSDEAETATGVDNYSWNLADLAEDACLSETATGENDGDAGKTYSAAIEIENDDNDIITSNSFSITCTGPEGDAKLSKFEVEATSGDLEYTDDVDDAISIYGYFVDQAGRPLGAGADLDLDDDFGLDYSANSSFSGDLDFNLYTDVTTDGTTKIEIGYLTPDMGYVAKFPYTISVDNSDLQSATAVAKSLATFYTATNPDAAVYTLTRVRNAAKTRATITADFGAECSNQMVDFDVELANGDVKFLTRRANINGVAKLTIERRNTKIYVKAFCNDGAQESNLRGIRFR